jgi:hypothetical protein
MHAVEARDNADGFRRCGAAPNGAIALAQGDAIEEAASLTCELVCHGARMSNLIQAI